MKKIKDEIIQGNCLEEMDKIYESRGLCVDFIFADTPYFLSNGGMTCQNGKMVKVNKGAWDTSKGANINHEFNIEWIKRCQKLLKPNGTIEPKSKYIRVEPVKTTNEYLDVNGNRSNHAFTSSLPTVGSVPANIFALTTSPT